MAKIWQFIHLDAFEKEEERLLFNLFIFSVFLRKDGFSVFTQKCDNFDGHSMVSKKVIEFFLWVLQYLKTTTVCLCMYSIFQNSGICMSKSMKRGFCYTYQNSVNTGHRTRLGLLTCLFQIFCTLLRFKIFMATCIMWWMPLKVPHVA